MNATDMTHSTSDASDCARANESSWAAYEDALRARFPSKEAVLAEARAQTVSQRRARHRRIQGTALGMLAIALVGGWWVDPVWRSQVVQTAVGERSLWTLRDGSRVELNTDTRLVAESRLRGRTFRLEKGEALFTVAHNWRPFVVSTPNSVVRDIGTAFNVRVQAQQDDITVTEGVVEVTAPGLTVPVRVEANQAARVLAGQAGKMGQAGAALTLTRHVDAAEIVAWHEGRLVFRETPLAQAAEQIQRYRPYRIEITDPAVAGLRLSGAYDIRGLDQLMRDLPSIVPVRIVRSEQGYEIRSAAR